MGLDVHEVVGDDGRRVILVRGEVDLYSSPDLREAILAAASEEPGLLAVDLREVAYMDSSGVATLIEGYRSALTRESAFILVAPSQAVMKVLQLTRLDAVFDIRDHL